MQTELKILDEMWCTGTAQCELTLLNRQTKFAADDILIFYFYLLQKIRLDVSSESSA